MFGPLLKVKQSIEISTRPGLDTYRTYLRLVSITTMFMREMSMHLVCCLHLFNNVTVIFCSSPCSVHSAADDAETS